MRRWAPAGRSDRWSELVKSGYQGDPESGLAKVADVALEAGPLDVYHGSRALTSHQVN